MNIHFIASRYNLNLLDESHGCGGKAVQSVRLCDEGGHCIDDVSTELLRTIPPSVAVEAQH